MYGMLSFVQHMAHFLVKDMYNVDCVTDCVLANAGCLCERDIELCATYREISIRLIGTCEKLK